jgi:hypothetical protein
MLVLGFGDIPDGDEKGEDDRTLKMIEILIEHGWDFRYSRDPVLILIEREDEENREHGENDE